MAEQVSHYFEVLIREVKRLALSTEVESDILEKLLFLKQQSLCDFERRESTSELRLIWKNVDRQMSQHGIYDRFQPSRRLWETIGMFVEVAQFRPIANRDLSSASQVKSLAYANVSRLFEIMSAACRDSTVRSSVAHDLIYLKEESKLPPAMRNTRQIQTVWKRVHSDLKRYSILKDFETEPMKGRLLEFLRGSTAELQSTVSSSVVGRKRPS